MNGAAEVLRPPDIDAAYLGGGYRTAITLSNTTAVVGRGWLNVTPAISAPDHSAP